VTVKRITYQDLTVTHVLPPGYVDIWSCRVYRHRFLVAEYDVKRTTEHEFACSACASVRQGVFR